MKRIISLLAVMAVMAAMVAAMAAPAFAAQPTYSCFNDTGSGSPNASPRLAADYKKLGYHCIKN